MQARRVRRSFAVAAAGVMLAGGAAFGTAGAATAAPAASTTTAASTVHRPHCYWIGGHWERHWFKDHHGHGHWVKVWVKGHWSSNCHRR
ncbi:hypothetical protein ACH4UR_21745 [Streptomyces lydicus]|uniref:hypothetical protein n=1 Tax=Streptomyces lydicus TaxID=47763 RepID=UPI0033E0B200